MTVRQRAVDDPSFTLIESYADLQKAIVTAAGAGQQLRVRGAMHSVPEAILADPGRGVNVILGGEFLNPAVMHTTPATVGTGAGIRLGGDPDENVPPSSGLLWFMSHLKPEWSVPDLGGITHQTIAGFLATGSSGGSLTYAFEDQIQSVTIVDGTGNPQVFDAASTTNPLGLAAVNMGLLGVITEVNLAPIPRFAIYGTESTVDVSDPKAPFQLFSSGSDGLAAFLRNQDYCRVMWWPQPKVGKLVIWTAEKRPLPSPFTPKPYRELGDPKENPATWPTQLPELIGNIIAACIEEVAGLLALWDQVKDTLPEIMVSFLESIIQAIVEEDREKLKKLIASAFDGEASQIGVDLYFSLLGNRLTNPLAERLFADIFTDEATWEGTWSPIVMNGIFLIDDPLKVKPGPQTFHDFGDTGLPMDDGISDYLMPTEFTELWIPIERTADVLNLLQGYYAGGYAHTGTYACELYATKQSQFWMSPATAGDVIRVDLFWFARNGDMTPQQFYQPFWDLLRKAGIPFRPHWGKFLPPPTTYGPTYYQGLYPRMADFLTARAKYDPQQVFVNDYWRAQLGIPSK